MVSQNSNSSTPQFPKIRFIRGVIGTHTILDDPRPVVAFIGRSNVGKSSLINTLTKSSEARSSATPGKTQEINYYSLGDQFYLVDLPGYGYAKISADEAEKIRKRIIWYFSESGVRPRAVVLLLDAKAGLTDLDRDMLSILRGENHPVLVVVNKIDKLNQREQSALSKKLSETITEDLFFVSALAKKNIGIVQSAILEKLEKNPTS